MITRDELGAVLSAQMLQRTIKSDCLIGTAFEKWELTEDWLVMFMEIDENGIMNIECVPKEYENR